jgi:peptide/nickel transport system substrate-binding protein
MIKPFLFSFLIVLSLISGAGCQQNTSTKQAIYFAIAQAPLNLDPRYATDAASERVNRLLYQRLVEFDASAKPVPGLASWQDISPTVFRFILNNDEVVFHHQKRLDAGDVKATYDSLMQLKDSPHRAEYANIKAIKVIDAQILEFTLNMPDSHFPEKLIIGILPKDLLVKNHNFVHFPVGSGAFKFDSWDRQLVLERRKDGQKIVLTEVKDPTVRVLKLMRGEADLLQGDLPPELVKYLQSQSDLQVKTTQGTNFSYLGLNMQDSVLKQLEVRQAISHAIDREAIIQQVMVNDSRLAEMILPPEHYAGNATLQHADYNPALAKQLLQSAGVQLPLKLVYKTSTDAQRVRLATILQAQMAAAGIELEIRSLDWGTFFAEVKQGNFQLYGLTWVGIRTPEIYSKVFGSQFMPPKGLNRGGYEDATLDALLQAENWPAVTARIHTQLPYIPLWYEGQVAVMQNDIQYYSPQSDGNWDNLATIQRSATISNYAH